MQPIQKSEYKYNKNGSFELFIETQLDSVKTISGFVFMVILKMTKTNMAPAANNKILDFQPIKRSNINEQTTNINPMTIGKEY